MVMPLLALVLVGCGRAATDPTPSASTSSPAGIANPASVYCESVGGTVEIVTTSDGQVGMCHLPDGTTIDEWELFRSAHASDTATS